MLPCLRRMWAHGHKTLRRVVETACLRDADEGWVRAILCQIALVPHLFGGWWEREKCKGSREEQLSRREIDTHVNYFAGVILVRANVVSPEKLPQQENIIRGAHYWGPGWRDVLKSQLLLHQDHKSNGETPWSNVCHRVLCAIHMYLLLSTLSSSPSQLGCTSPI